MSPHFWSNFAVFPRCTEILPVVLVTFELIRKMLRPTSAGSGLRDGSVTRGLEIISINYSISSEYHAVVLFEFLILKYNVKKSLVYIITSIN